MEIIDPWQGRIMEIYSHGMVHGTCMTSSVQLKLESNG